ASLGDGGGRLTLDGGALRSDASMTVARAVTLGANDGTLDTNGHAVTVSGDISGSGGLRKTGAGALTLSGANSYGGGTVIAGGTLQLGQGTTTGGIVGDVRNDGALVFNRSNAYRFDGVISG